MTSPFNYSNTQNNPISRWGARTTIGMAAARGSWRAQMLLQSMYAGGKWEFSPGVALAFNLFQFVALGGLATVIWLAFHSGAMAAMARYPDLVLAAWCQFP